MTIFAAVMSDEVGLPKQAASGRIVENLQPPHSPHDRTLGLTHNREEDSRHRQAHGKRCPLAFARTLGSNSSPVQFDQVSHDG